MWVRVSRCVTNAPVTDIDTFPPRNPADIGLRDTRHLTTVSSILTLVTADSRLEEKLRDLQRTRYDEQAVGQIVT